MKDLLLTLSMIVFIASSCDHRSRENYTSGDESEVTGSSPSAPTVEEVKRQEVRNNIEKYIEVHVSPDPKYLGGYKSFYVEMENQSDYAVDYYSLNIEVYQSSGALYDTKMAEIFEVPAHSKKGAFTSGCNRGSSYKLTHVILRSKDLGMY